MRLRQVEIRNFRAIEHADITIDDQIAVIVGPNAIGKTTILEAIRAARAILAPRTPNESIQVMLSIGASVPYNPQQIIVSALQREPNEPITIRCRYELNNNEIEAVRENRPFIIRELASAGLGPLLMNPAAVAQYFSSPDGQRALEIAEKTYDDGIESLARSRSCRLNLTIDPRNGLRGDHPLEHIIVGFLDKRLPPSKTIFSYFPADRALPLGEQPIQFGSQDAGLQLESHNSQAQTKYSRLKNAIFSTVVASQNGRAEVSSEFGNIFDNLLSGRVLEDVGVNHVGLLSIRVQDLATGRVFDLDSLSSGEKGIVLTFFLIAQSIADGGIILLDEPELHLNPSVCRMLLPFLSKSYIVPKNAQAILCTHSPEVLSSALDIESCSLYHVVSEADTRLFRPSDEAEVSSALTKLGSSQFENLLYNGSVFVEGQSDKELLEAGFSDRLARYNVRPLGGRPEIEKQIRTLQAAERDGHFIGRNAFIFDHDRKPSEIAPSQNVRIKQWERYCIENYLIDDDILWKMLSNTEVIQDPFKSREDLGRHLRSIAMGQLDDTVALEVYQGIGFEDPHARRSEIEGRKLEEIASQLDDRLARYRDQLNALGSNWKSDFVEMCRRRRGEVEAEWEAKWREICSGKRFFRDLYRSRTFRTSRENFLRRIMEQLRMERRPLWCEMEMFLNDVIPSVATRDRAVEGRLGASS